MRLRTLLIVVHGGGQYQFTWKDRRDLPALYAVLADLAGDPELVDFSWHTALQVVQLIAQNFPTLFEGTPR